MHSNKLEYLKRFTAFAYIDRETGVHDTTSHIKIKNKNENNKQTTLS